MSNLQVTHSDGTVVSVWCLYASWVEPCQVWLARCNVGQDLVTEALVIQRRCVRGICVHLLVR